MQLPVVTRILGRVQCCHSPRHPPRHSPHHPRHHTAAASFADVVVLGGGMVGGALACALGTHPAFRDKSVLVLEAGPKATSPLPSDAPYSNRVCEISPGSVTFLDGIGVWDLIGRQRLKPVQRMQVWDASTDSHIVFDSAAEAEHVTSWTVENDVTTRAIGMRLDALEREGANIRVEYATKVEGIRFPRSSGGRRGGGGRGAATWVELTLGDGAVVETRLLVGADGANSAARKAASIPTVDYDYGQMGVVATLTLRQAEALGNTVAWQRFLPSGPIALLPLDDVTSSLVWSTTKDEATRLVNVGEAEFVEAVNGAIWGEVEDQNAAVRKAAQKYSEILGGSSGRQLPPSVVGVQTGSRTMFPLKMAHAVDYVKPRLALIGDAAHRIHPMAGQGVNLGFGDAAHLAEILADGASRGEDLGSPLLLTPYETSRQRKVVPLIAGLQGLHLLYGSSWAPVVAARSFGLQSVDAVPGLKSFLMKFAMDH